MTKPAFAPGCFGSAIFYRAMAPECAACASSKACATSATVREAQTLDRVSELDRQHAQDRSEALQRWFRSRAKVDTGNEQKRSSALQRLSAWKSKGLNVYHLKHRTNPAPKGTVMHVICAFIIEVQAFTRRDLTEELRERYPDQSKAALKRYADEVCDALLEAKIITNEKRGTLCLTN